MKKIKKVIIVFANERMLQREADLYKRLGSMINASIQSIVVSEIEYKKISADTVMVVDEADFCVLDCLMKIPTGCGLVIGFTASPATGLDNVEANFISKLGFKFFQSTFKKPISLKPDATTLEDFFAKVGHINEPIRIVYCEESFVDDVKKVAGDGFIIRMNEENAEILVGLDMVPGQVLIVTDPDLMRGIDYRAPSCGIHLLIARAFQHTRAARQGLGRVGRQGDKFERKRLDTLVDIVDKNLEAAFIGNLNK